MKDYIFKGSCVALMAYVAFLIHDLARTKSVEPCEVSHKGVEIHSILRRMPRVPQPRLPRLPKQPKKLVLIS